MTSNVEDQRNGTGESNGDQNDQERFFHLLNVFSFLLKAKAKKLQTRDKMILLPFSTVLY